MIESSICCPEIPVCPLNLPLFNYDLLLPSTVFTDAQLILDYQNRKMYLQWL
jgi:hypothetical protein